MEEGDGVRCNLRRGLCTAAMRERMKSHICWQACSGLAVNYHTVHIHSQRFLDRIDLSSAKSLQVHVVLRCFTVNVVLTWSLQVHVVLQSVHVVLHQLTVGRPCRQWFGVWILCFNTLGRSDIIL